MIFFPSKVKSKLDKYGIDADLSEQIVWNFLENMEGMKDDIYCFK